MKIFSGIELRNIPQILSSSLESIRGEIDTALKVLNNFMYPEVDDFLIRGQRKLVDSKEFYDIEKSKKPS